MKQVLTAVRLALLAVVPLVTACAAPSEYPVTKLHQSSRCPIQDETLRLVASPEELAHLTMSGLLGRPSAGAQPQPDFADQWVVLLALGQQPTAGYSIALSGGTATVSGDALRLPVDVTEPAPGSIQAQVITSPCLVVAVPKGAYARISARGHSIPVAD